jgi:folate-binding Fe-S cluster repair protein YgfZ
MNKGCYPGQEVVEKTISLGQPAQRLCLIEGAGAPPELRSPIMNLADPPAEVGKVTSAESTENGFIALGFVRKIQAKEGSELKINGTKGTVKIAKVSHFMGPRPV